MKSPWLAKIKMLFAPEALQTWAARTRVLAEREGGGEGGGEGERTGWRGEFAVRKKSALLH